MQNVRLLDEEAMLRRAVEVALAANGAVVLSHGLSQIDAKPRTLCNMDGPDIFDKTRPMGVCLNLLADLEFRHGGWRLPGSCVVDSTAQLGAVFVELQGDASELERTEIAFTDWRTLTNTGTHSALLTRETLGCLTICCTCRHLPYMDNRRNKRYVLMQSSVITSHRYLHIAASNSAILCSISGIARSCKSMSSFSLEYVSIC